MSDLIQDREVDSVQLDPEHETLIGAINEQNALSHNLRSLLAKVGNSHGIRTFEHHSKAYRDKTLDQLIELAENLHDANRAIIRKLKKLKRVKPTQEQVDALLDGKPL